MALSSAILYLAIVAIPAIVLLPPWLRPPQASWTLESNLAEPVVASALEDLAEAEERVLHARRRMLVALPGITAGAVAIAVAHLAAAWVVIPPAVMLAGFVLLLREAARIDTERAWDAAWRHGRRTGAGAAAVGVPERQQAGPADSARAGVASARAGMPGPQAGVASAQIIDLSARIGDQLYDQYADAEVRAVGD